MDKTLDIEALRDLGLAVLTRAGVPAGTAACVVDALVRAECDAIPTHGFSRLPNYADHVASGKVRVDAPPAVSRPRPAAVLADARCGFAFPAIDAGLEAAMPVAREQGCCVLAIANSHHCGVAGHHVERAADHGLAALMCSNTPAAMAPWGGHIPSFGTNPVAFACPRPADPPLVVDLSLSKVTRGRVMAAARRGEKIPEGWVLDTEGRPTTDPSMGLKGTMVPLGDAKGAALALVVEILTAALSGSNFAFEGSSFFLPAGEPPRMAHFFLLLRTDTFSPDFGSRLEALLAHMLGQPGVRLPGDRRLASRRQAETDGVTLPEALYQDLLRRSGR